jgi:hypothetical protein
MLFPFDRMAPACERTRRIAAAESVPAEGSIIEGKSHPEARAQERVPAAESRSHLAISSVDAGFRQGRFGRMTGLKRALNPMPDDVRAALTARSLMTAYEARPDYQKNDYLDCIARAKRPDTRQKRLDQMLDDCSAAAST